MTDHDSPPRGVPTFEQFQEDTRAIEGLPIRLVIGLVVGVASLSVMMGMISDLGSIGVTEVDAEPDPDVVTAGETHDLDITVVDADGNSVAESTVVLQDDSASLEEGVQTAETDANGVATFSIRPELHPNQQQGVLSIDIKPPSGGDYADQRDNTDILVIED